MKFSFNASPALKDNTKYVGEITSVNFIDLDKATERVLVNVLVKGFAQPSPASFSTASETGARMLSDLLVALGAKKSNCSSPEKIATFLKGKNVVVRVKPSKDGQYVNTTISAPRAEATEEAEEGNGATI